MSAQQEKLRRLGFPKMIFGVYDSAAIGPHANTLRFSYTVPDFRQANIEFLELDLERYDAATTNRNAIITLGWQPKIADNPIYQTLVNRKLCLKESGSRNDWQLSKDLSLKAGDLITIFTKDLSTDGTVIYLVSIKILETDA
jgi:hypothetical protein